jgi:hypothetical protein
MSKVKIFSFSIAKIKIIVSKLYEDVSALKAFLPP